MPKIKVVHQFLIVLTRTDPLVWRRIVVPDGYTFWDLHVAIQDAMGWQDYHLHEFQVIRYNTMRPSLLGIPVDDFDPQRPRIPSWEVKVTDVFSPFGHDNVPGMYVYDFGDNWRHALIHEGVQSPDPLVKYPRCIAGARKCPPEDCGGIPGYLTFLEAIADPTHPEHEEYLEWVGGSYDPNAFDPTKVVFDDPRKRWETAFRK